MAAVHARGGLGCDGAGRSRSVDQAWQLFDLINPLQHARDAAGVQRYKVEPYVIAADIYGVGAHAGRGGWSWYTGSAGWMYRLIVESLLGLHLEHDDRGPGCACSRGCRRRGRAFPSITGAPRRTWQVRGRRGAHGTLQLDGESLPAERLPLEDDGACHSVLSDRRRLRPGARRYLQAACGISSCLRAAICSPSAFRSSRSCAPSGTSRSAPP